MSDGLINPDAIPIPAANTWEIESAAAGMKSDGGDISQAGHDIKSTWAGLQSVYSAPESETLFAAVDPVSAKGDDVETALNTAAQALETFAETAQRIRGELIAARGEARQFLADIEGDEDWNSGEHPFDFESKKGQEHDALLSRINGLVHEYQEAERTCANAITGTFGGTTFIAGDAEGTTQPGADEMVYGFDEPLENVATPWGTPQGIDHFWTVDAAWAAWDVVRGSVEDVGGAVGAYGEPGWFTGDWGDNFDAYWGDVLAGMGAAAGVWNPETQDWTNSFGEGVQVSTDAGLSALHGFFPWTELEERPGYAWGTLGTNAAFIVGGVALSMTGVGAVVGVPMAASRLTRIFGGIGSGEGVPGGGEGSGGYDGSEGNGNGNGGNRPRSADSGSQSPQAPEEGGISADDHYESSGIGGMNESLSDLENSQTQGPPTTPDTPPPSQGVPDRPSTTSNSDVPVSDEASPLERADAPEHVRAPEHDVVGAELPELTSREAQEELTLAEMIRNDPELLRILEDIDADLPEQLDSTDPDAPWAISPLREPEMAMAGGSGEGGGPSHNGGGPLDTPTAGTEHNHADTPGTSSGDSFHGGSSGSQGYFESNEFNFPTGDSELAEEEKNNNPQIEISDYIPGGSLQANEYHNGEQLGHTLERHVEKSDHYLRQRTLQNPDPPGIPFSGKVAGRYKDLETAELATATAIRMRGEEIQEWLDLDPSLPENHSLVLRDVEVNLGEIGFALERQGSKNNPTGWIPRDPRNVRVLLRYHPDFDPPYYVHTSFPTPAPNTNPGFNQ
ncbi:RNase A-like domain-containing protein [Nocardiopsis dassonvillei]|uniref:RNase A-like domain-containing protein n=1 Tax=Nocardiopsis dassonvillei TaxID=2014 RepID=UPI00157C0505|nr:RNase A-like domain-containing protein [Nocardiopsis dassonvillei]